MNKATQKLGATPILGDGTQPRKKKTPICTISRRSESFSIYDHPSDHENACQQGKRRKRRSESFSTSDPPPYLQIQSVPIAKRVDPERNSYVLMLQPVGIRAAGGQYSADEANEIAKATRGWDFSLDEDGEPRCLPRLIALLDGICKRSALAKEGGAS